MALSNQQYDKILKKYHDARMRNDRIQHERKAEVYAKSPEYKELDDQVSTISVSLGRKLIGGDESAIYELREKLREIKEQKYLALVRAGFPEDYLEPIYDCPLCKDTGYVERERCSCFKQAITEVLYEQSNIRSVLQTENFSTLSYSYYQGDDLLHFKNAVETCRNFVNNFNSDYHNLFFYGTVGTGKSFLSGCVAKELLEKGNMVLYFSSKVFFETISKLSFDNKSKEEFNQLMEDLYYCDLLIIDDLGTELTNSFVASELFSILNERHIRKKATVISSNLSLEELRDRYSDRIFSRITSNFEICKITGPDIRMYKKRMLNRK